MLHFTFLRVKPRAHSTQFWFLLSVVVGVAVDPQWRHINMLATMKATPLMANVFLNIQVKILCCLEVGSLLIMTPLESCAVINMN